MPPADAGICECKLDMLWVGTSRGARAGVGLAVGCKKEWFVQTEACSECSLSSCSRGRFADHVEPQCSRMRHGIGAAVRAGAVSVEEQLERWVKAASTEHAGNKLRALFWALVKAMRRGCQVRSGANGAALKYPAVSRRCPALYLVLCIWPRKLMEVWHAWECTFA